MRTRKKEKLHLCKGNHETAKCQKLLKYKEPLSSKHRKSGNMIKTAHNICCVILSTRLQKHKTCTKHLTRNAEYLKYGLTLCQYEQLLATTLRAEKYETDYGWCLSMFLTCSSNVTIASQNCFCLNGKAKAPKSAASRHPWCQSFQPLLKKPDLDPSDGKSYWPISNLTVLSKVLERLVNSSDISVSGSCWLNCSQRTAPITQPRLQYFESLATFSKHWIAAIWQLLRCSTYLPRLTVSTTSCYFVDWQRLQSSYGIRSTVLDWFTSYL